jgi:hypothetical protein
MATIQQSIEVKVPLHTAYNQLTKFENYPRFMEDVESVQQIDDTHLHWTTRMANRPVEWDAEITEREPGRYIAWHNTSGPTNTAKVEVRQLGPDTAQVTFTLHSEPEQVPGSMTGFTEQEMAQRLKQDLARLKDFIETGGPASQASTSEQPQNQVQSAPPIQMRHLGEMPQDTTAEQHGGVPSSDAIGKSRPVTEQSMIASASQTQSIDQARPQPDTQHASPTNSAPPSGGHPAAAPEGIGASAVVGASGGTDAAAGAHLSGSKGGPGGPSPRQTSDATGAPGTPGGMIEGNAVSPAAGAGAAGGTGLGDTATASDTRTGTGTTSGSGTVLTGGGMSGARDAGKGSSS